ncbi:PAS domain S-box-containing protein [Azospirillum fermentarium]|uniref:ATP-binding protein n=1 Tax=Azospirillum fermentarium TaxID=1233114 RepID=UPI0022260516|nr:ATP-binding protein [Azospirillum fermentarium]MCW2246256.1 PAS domain S-box-containing protein [Azospirillum fermentarium]
MTPQDCPGPAGQDRVPPRGLTGWATDMAWRSLASVPFLMVASGIAFILVVNALIGYGIWQNRRDALDAAQHNLEQSARMLDEQVVHAIEAADWLFADIDAMMVMGGEIVNDPRTAASVFRYLRLRREAFPPVADILVAGPDGRVRYSASGNRPVDFDLHDRPYFTVHRDRVDAGLYVGTPLAGWSHAKSPVVPISRRLTLADGGFGGVMVILLSPSALDSAFAAARIKRGGSALLALEAPGGDGQSMVLTNQYAVDALVGASLSDWPALNAALGRAQAGTRVLESVGGIDYLVSFRRTARYPFILVTTQPQSDALADWRRDTAAWSFVGLAMTSAIAVLTWFVVRQHRRREQDQEKLAQASRRIRGILESMMDAVITIDSHGRIETFNRAAEVMFGYREAEAVGQSIDMLIPEPFRLDHGRWLEEYRPGRGSRIIGNDREVMAQRRDGAVFPMNLAVSELVLNQGDADRRLFVGVIRDITIRKQKEAEVLAAKSQAEMANRAKSEFLANMSHELRTPLNAIIGFSEILDSEFFGKLNERQKACAKDIYDSGRHLLDIVNAVLDMSKIEAGRYELTEELFDPSEALTQCLTMVRERAADAKVELLHALNIAHPSIWADRRAFKQVILNLLSNAVKFTPKGGRVTLDALVDEDGCLVVSVSDTGIGIPADFMAHLFEPFRQADNSTSRRYEGTGLGLSISKNFMELHGGTLACASEVGVGTTMTARLPASRVMSGDPRAALAALGMG